jgi:hypothetical protein
MLRKISNRLAKGRSAFLTVSPGLSKLIRPLWLKETIRTVPHVAGALERVIRGDPFNEIAEDAIAGSISSRITSRLFKDNLKAIVMKGHSIAKVTPLSNIIKELGATRRTWVTSEVDKNIFNNRIIKNLTIVYHDANKAGKHIDVHMGHLSMVYRISGKPFENDLKFNSQGRLTEASKEIILTHLKAEIYKNSRVPWNHDHTISNAKASWAYDQALSLEKGYGSGPTRQIIYQDKCEFYHPEVKSSLHIYAPLLNPNQGLYVYQIYEGNGKSAPILILGTLIPRDEKFQDRLHLKMIQDKDFKSEFLRKVDHETITRKYDGASTYFTGSGKIERNESFKLFSPRHSKETGHRIEYTYKVAELSDRPNDVRANGIGELLFWKKTPIGKMLGVFGVRGPECIAWNYLPSTNIAGVLNSNGVRPKDIYPEVRIYRMDRFKEENTFNLPFFKNRSLQEQLIGNLDQRYWKVVGLADARRIQSWEGLVGVPTEESINSGLKVKWWADSNDWKVTEVDLSISEKQHVQGVVWFKSLESGKEFKLGPSNLGSVDRQMEFIENPSKMIGHVFKVHGRNGHEGRAAKIVDEHMDK